MNHLPGQIVSDEDYKKIILEIMDSIDFFCRNHGIQYYMLGGTMLGAIRHHGIIPWDDDIDIGMKRSDYERFCQEYKDEHKKNYKVISVNSDKHYYQPAAKVIDTDISLYENLNQAIEIGAYVDVFPLDYVTLNEEGKCSFFENKLFVRKIESLKRMKPMRGRSLWKNILIGFGHVVCPMSVHEIVKNLDKYAIKCSSINKTPWLANLHGAWREKEIIDSKVFDCVSEYDFDGRKLFGVKDYETYLRQLYGDYMQLPPPEKRITHHSYIAKWKK